MDFSLPPDVRKLKERAAKIFKEVYEPVEEDILASNFQETALIENVTGEFKKRAIEAGLWAMEVSKHNEQRLGFLGRIAIEEMVGATVLPSLDLGGNGDLLIWMENPSVDSRKGYFDSVIKGDKDYEVAYLEPNISESLSRSYIRAVELDGKVQLTGGKNIISNKQKIDFLILLASLQKSGEIEPVFYIAEHNRKGVSVTIDEQLPLGFRKLNIRLTDCETSGSDRLVKEGYGFEVARKRECLRNLILAARSSGAAWRCIEMTTQYYKENEQVNKHQAMQTMLADSVVDMHAARLLTLSQAQEIDDNKYDFMMTSTSKVFSTEASSRAIEKMIQIWADKGYLKRLPFETLYRIVRFYRIIDQPSEVCRKNIAYGTMGRELA